MKLDLIWNQIGSNFFMKMTRTKSSKKSKKSISRPKLRFHQKYLYKKKVRMKTKGFFWNQELGNTTNNMPTILNVINIARGSHAGCKCYIHSKAFDVICHVAKVTRRIRSIEKQKLQKRIQVHCWQLFLSFKYVNFMYVQFHHVWDLFLQPIYSCTFF